MRPSIRLVMCVGLLLAPVASAQLEALENPGTVAAVQDRLFRMNHELHLGVGVLPLDAFYKGVTASVGYTAHFSDTFAWTVGRGLYSYNLDTGLRGQLENQFGVAPTEFEEVEWMVGSDLVWSPWYGKTSFLNQSVTHFDVSLVAGASVLRMVDRSFRPGAEPGHRRAHLRQPLGVLAPRLHRQRRGRGPRAARGARADHPAVPGPQLRRHRVRRPVSLLRPRPGPLARLLVLALGVLPLGVRRPGPAAVSAPCRRCRGSPRGRSAAARTPATPEAAPPPPEKVDPKLFEQGVGAFFAGDTRAAAPLLFRYVQATPSTDENHAWAQYFLGRALIDLGLKHAGGTYLARVARERSNPEVLPRALEALQTLTDGPHDEVLIDEEIFGAMDLGFLPDGVRDWTHLQQGLVDLRTGSERWARTHFAKISDGSLEASQARFAILVTRLRDAKEKVPDALVEDFLETAKDERLPQRTRNEAYLAVGRLRYERGDFEGALRRLRQGHPAVARSRPGHALPGGGLDPLPARRAARVAGPAHHPGRAELPGRVPAGQVPAAGLHLPRPLPLPARQARGARADPPLRRLAAGHHRARGAHRRRAPGARRLQPRRHRSARPCSWSRWSWRASSSDVTPARFGDRLFSHLAKLYTLARSEAIRVHRERLEEGVREEADRLLRAAEQVRLMEYEVGLKLYERIKQDARLVPPPEEDALSPAQVAFAFNGEYWNDELRSYRVSIKSRCVEETP